MRAAGPTLGVTPLPFTVESPTDIDLAALAKLHPDALYVFPNSINGRHSKSIVAYAAANRLPAIYGEREVVEGRRPDVLLDRLDQPCAATPPITRTDLQGRKAGRSPPSRSRPSSSW